MPTPTKPLELKRKLGNPGRQKLPDINSTITLTAGYVEPHQALGVSGTLLWERVFNFGQTWISPRTDVELLLITCKQLDRQLLFEDQDIRIIHFRDHLFRIRDEIRGDVAAVELHAFNDIKFGL
jgi:hypothetical protein